MTSFSASSSVPCTVWPSCQRNSVVRMKGLVEVISARKTEFQTLMRTGRSRQLFTHLLYDSLIIVSEVGLMASRSPSSLLPECVTQKTSGEPLEMLRLSLQQPFGYEQGKVGVPMSELFDLPVEVFFDALPDG